MKRIAFTNAKLRENQCNWVAIDDQRIAKPGNGLIWAIVPGFWICPAIAGTEIKITKEGIPSAIPAEMCYLGWQESLEKLATLVGPEFPDAWEYCSVGSNAIENVLKKMFLVLLVRACWFIMVVPWMKVVSNNSIDLPGKLIGIKIL